MIYVTMSNLLRENAAGKLANTTKDYQRLPKTIPLPTDDWLLRLETVWLSDIPATVLKKPVVANPIQILTSIRSPQYTEIIVNQSSVLMRKLGGSYAFDDNLLSIMYINDGVIRQ